MHDVIPNLTVEDRERSLGWLALWLSLIHI